MYSPTPDTRFSISSVRVVGAAHSDAETILIQVGYDLKVIAIQQDFTDNEDWSKPVLKQKLRKRKEVGLV